jgi:hypothetical protein
METTQEPLHLDKRSFAQWKTVDMPTSFVWIIILTDLLNMAKVGCRTTEMDAKLAPVNVGA